jgi:DNA-binding beta-propeller fold protein YncE
MRTVTIARGCEDFVFQENGPRGPRLLLAAADRRPFRNKRGTLWSFDLATEEKREIAIPMEVHPAGIALDGTRLYVTNNKEPRSIEVFTLSGDTLTHDRSMKRPEAKLLNDVCVAPNGDVYATDLKRNEVIRWTGDGRTVFKSDLDQPNGIAADAEHLYVAEFKSKRLLIFDRNGAQQNAIQLDGHPDNLQWEVPGRVLDVAMHVSYWRIGTLIVTGMGSSPSRGCRVEVGAGAPVVTKLYDLPDFNGGSTALATGGRIYVSQVLGDQLAIVDR